MEQRFTVKDFLLFSTLGLLFVTLLLAMYMVDRQWEKMAQMRTVMEEQAGDLRGLKEAIRALDRRIESRAITLRSDAADTGDGVPPAFRRAYEATRKPDYSPGDWLVQAFGVNLKSITPFLSGDAYASAVQDYVLESLLTRNPDTLAWEGLLADSWRISDDGLTFTFKLRPEAKFSDGSPITAEDVVFSFDFIMNDAIRAPRERAYYGKIKSVEARNEHEVVFRFKEPYFDALTLAGGLPVLPKHFYQPYLKNPNDYNQSKGLLLGSGPYRLADPKGWTPDKGLVELERNPRYWGPVLPGFERVLWRIIENDSARLTTFRNADIDSYAARPREYQRLLDDKELAARTNHEEYMSPVGGYSYIGWNQARDGKPTRFADKRVRRAMTYLTDLNRLIEDIYLGYAEPAVGPFNPSGPQHDPALKAPSYDLEKARSLLHEAGFEDRDGDGVLEDAAGEPFEFELVYFQDNEDTKRAVLLLKDLFGRAGILLKPKPTEWSVLLDLLNKRDFDAITLGWTGTLESDPYQIFHSSQIGDGGDNFIGYQNAKLDALIDKARSTVDEKTRMPLWHEVEAVLVEDQPYTFLTRGKSLVFLDRRLKNLEITKLGLNLTRVPVEIYVPAGEQRHRR